MQSFIISFLINDDFSLSTKNIFVSNTVRNSGVGDYQVAHGAEVGDYWVSNIGESPIVWGGVDPKSSANVSVFEP